MVIIKPSIGSARTTGWLLLLALALFPLAQAEAKTVTIGTGSGTLSVTSMSSLSLVPGDTIAITSGTYNGATFIHLNNVTIVPKTGGVTFHGPVGIGDDVSVVFDGTVLPGVMYGYTFSGAVSAAFASVVFGNTVNCTIKGVQAINTGGCVLDGSGEQITYTGTPASCIYYNMTLDTIKETGTASIYSGTWAANSIYHNVNIGMTLKNIVCLNDGSGPTAKVVSYSLYNMVADNWIITGPTIGNTGDGGIFNVIGNCTLKNIYRNGAWGWLLRVFNCSLNMPSTTYVYNCVDIGNTAYGSIDTRVNSTDILAATTIPIVGNDIKVYNVTAGNHLNGTGYRSNLLIDYDNSDHVTPTPHVYETDIINCFTFNNANPAGVNNGLYADVADAPKVVVMSNNIDVLGVLPAGYLTDANKFYPAPGGPLIGTGLTESINPTDVYSIFRGAVFDIGAVQHDTLAPTVAITSPTLVGTYTTPAATVNLGGTAGDNDFVSSVTWSNSLGGSGTASSSTTWTTTGLPVASSTWTISNLPLTVGTNVITVTGTDASGNTGTTLLTVARTSSPTAPAITSPVPPGGNAGTPYTFTYTATGSPSPTFSVSSGNLPSGLSLSPGGILTGTPSVGTYSGAVTADNGVVPAAVQPFTIAVQASTPTQPAITNAPLSATAITGIAYSFTYTATGYPIPTFNVTPGSLPSGFLLSPTGMLTGTPTTAGTYSGTITAANGVGTAASQAFTLIVQLSTTAQPAILNGPATTTALVGSAYSFTYAASGYPLPTFTVSSGQLPAGLSLSTSGAISGTPTATGNYSGMVTAANGIGSVATQSFTINVQPQPPPTVYFNFAYNASSLGNWNSLSGNNAWVVGQPNSVIANAKDFNTGNPTTIGLAVTGTFTYGQNYGVASTALYPSPIQTYAFATTGSASLTVNGLNPALLYNVTAFGSGASSLTGQGNFIIGTTTLKLAIGGNTGNTVTFNNVVPDNTGHIVLTVSQGTMSNYNDISVLILSQSSAAPVITNSPPSTATFGTAYSFTYSATGTPTPTFSITSGSLPPGLSLSSTGTISGTPTRTGNYASVISANNGINPAASQNFNLTVMGTYSQWFAPYFSALPQNIPNPSDPTTILQGDGLSNLMKYLLDINPSTPLSAADRLALPVTSLTNGSPPYLTLTYRRNTAATGITVKVQISSDLQTWQTVTPDTVQNVGTDSATGDSIIRVGVNATGMNKEFIRLQVTQP